MIYLNLTVNNPWSDRFNHVFAKSGKITKHKAWEFEVYRSDTIVEFETRLSIRQDHAGFQLGFGLFSWTVRFQLYDTRHWNYDKSQWEVYPDEG